MNRSNKVRSMKRFPTDFVQLDHIRLACPERLTRVAWVSLNLLQTDTQHLRILRQHRDTGRTDYSFDVESWGKTNLPLSPYHRSLSNGRRIAERKDQLDLYAVRALFAQTMQRKSQEAGMSKPYNVFGVWLLFVAGTPVNLDEMSPELVQTIGQVTLETTLMLSEDIETLCEGAVDRILDAIADIEESRIRHPTTGRTPTHVPELHSFPTQENP